jgi:hypothetical protein
VELPLSRTFEDLLSEDESKSQYKIIPQRSQKNLIWAIFLGKKKKENHIVLLREK